MTARPATAGGPRIAFVHFGAYPDIRLNKQVNTFAEAGWQVRVLARSLPSSGTGHPYGAAATARATSFGDLIDVTAVARPGHPGVLSMPYGTNPLWVREVSRLVRDFRPELLVIRDIPLMPAAVLATKGTSTPLVLDMAENYPAVLGEWRRWEGRRAALVNGVLRNVRLARRLEKWSVGHADAVVAVVQESADRLTSTYGVGGVTIVENTPELPQVLAAAQALGDDPYVDRAPIEVVYAGEVHYYRGIDTVIGAARLLRNGPGPRVRWTLVGAGKKMAELQAMAVAAGVEQDIRFLGWQPDLFPLIAGADVGVVPSHRSEHTESTMPNKLYDYMALGKPVIVSDVRPMQRVVSQERCGVVFRAGDEASLAQAVLALQEPQVRVAAGARAAQAVRTRYNWDVDGARMVELAQHVRGHGRTAS